MRGKIAALLCLIVFLMGCATARKSSNAPAPQLRNRIASLEDDLQRKNSEIVDLENQIEAMHDKRGVSRVTQVDNEEITEPNALSIGEIQQALKNAGFYKGQIDGKKGPQTIDAIKAFQKSRKLKVDGVSGKKTLEALQRYHKH